MLFAAFEIVVKCVARRGTSRDTTWVGGDVTAKSILVSTFDGGSMIAGTNIHRGRGHDPSKSDDKTCSFGAFDQHVGRRVRNIGPGEWGEREFLGRIFRQIFLRGRKYHILGYGVGWTSLH